MNNSILNNSISNGTILNNSISNGAISNNINDIARISEQLKILLAQRAEIDIKIANLYNDITNYINYASSINNTNNANVNITKLADTTHRENNGSDFTDLLNTVSVSAIIEKSTYTIPEKQTNTVSKGINDISKQNKSQSLEKKEYIPQVESDGWREARKRNRMIHRAQPITPFETSIQITQHTCLPAICVSDFADVIDDGKLYYVERANHFAMYILKKLYHGNIGTIYHNEKTPLKIKNCQFHSKDHMLRNTVCNYYHDPTIFSESNDVRNYVANSWVYQRGYRADEHIRCRKFGSVDHIDEDISGMKSDDITKFRDMVFHDLLCAFILSG